MERGRGSCPRQLCLRLPGGAHSHDHLSGRRVNSEADSEERLTSFLLEDDEALPGLLDAWRAHARVHLLGDRPPRCTSRQHVGVSASCEREKSECDVHPNIWRGRHCVLARKKMRQRATGTLSSSAACAGLRGMPVSAARCCAQAAMDFLHTLTAVKTL